MLKDLLGNRIRVGLAQVKMCEIPDTDAEKVVTVGDVVDYIKDNVE